MVHYRTRKSRLMFRELEHNSVFSIYLSPAPKNTEIEYPSMSHAEAADKLNGFKFFLSDVVNSLYSGAEIVETRNEVNGEHSKLYFVDCDGRILAQILFGIQSYNIGDKRPKDFTPVISLDIGVENYGTICSLMSRLGTHVVLRRRGKIKEGNNYYYALLSESEPVKVKRECYLTDEKALERAGIGARMYKVFD